MGEAIRTILTSFKPTVVDHDQQLAGLWREWVPSQPTLVDDNLENLQEFIHLSLRVNQFYTGYILDITDKDRIQKTSYVDGLYTIYFRLKQCRDSMFEALKGSLFVENNSINKTLFLSCYLRDELSKELVQEEFLNSEYNAGVFVSKVHDRMDSLSCEKLWPDLVLSKYYSSDTESSKLVNGARPLKDIKLDLLNLIEHVGKHSIHHGEIKWGKLKNILLQVIELPILDEHRLKFSDICDIIDALKEGKKIILTQDQIKFFNSKWNRKLLNILFHTLSQTENSCIPIAQHNQFIERWDKLRIDKMGKNTIVSYLGKKNSRNVVQIAAYENMFLRIQARISNYQESNNHLLKEVKEFLQKIIELTQVRR